MATRKKRSKTHRRKVRKVRTLGRKVRKTKSLRKKSRKSRSKRGGNLNLMDYRGMTLPQFRGLGSIGRQAEYLEAPLQNTART